MLREAVPLLSLSFHSFIFIIAKEGLGLLTPPGAHSSFQLAVQDLLRETVVCHVITSSQLIPRNQSKALWVNRSRSLRCLLDSGHDTSPYSGIGSPKALKTGTLGWALRSHDSS